MSFNEALKFMRRNPEYMEVLKRIVAYEEEHCKNQYFETLGWEWRDVRTEPAVLKKLFLAGILRNPYKSRSHCGYLLVDREAVKRALEYAEAEEGEVEGEPEPFEVSESIFEDIVGYEDVKKLFLKGLRSRVHFLMVGPPASAKSLFLLCLERLLGAKYVVGSRASKAGITDLLVTCKPRILLIDEIDKMRGEDLSALLSMMETGVVVETVYGKQRRVQLDTVVFAAANTLKRLPEEVQSRFQVLHFREYSRAEFLEIVTHALKRRGFDEGLSKHVAKAVWDILESRDPRQAVRIAKLASTVEDVDSVVAVLLRHL